MCGKKLSTFGINEHNGEKYCSSCYDDVTSPVCKACAQPLKDYWTEVEGENYHEDCFKCAKCNKTLNQRGYFGSGGLFYCRGCA